MKKILSFLFQASFVACCSLITHSPVAAQPITTDGTLEQPTEVTPTDAGVEINGGTAQGGNLFHSFNDFSVPTGSEAHFNNNADVDNILGRVTGGNVSNIDGLIRANGSANLFLINPAGIIFGEGASLDIGGSFFGSTADSLLFDEGGEFSATNPEVEPILTINAPIGLNLRDNPQPISNRSTANGVGLEVQPGKNITLVGGELNFDGGILTAPGGRIELGGLSTAGEIKISENGSLTFPGSIPRDDITLTNGAEVNVAADGGGFINVNARNLSLSTESQLLAGIAENSISNAQAGNIMINVIDNLTLDDSRITNQVAKDGVGNSGRIKITTGSMKVINGGDINASTNGQGNAGLVEITAKGDITFDGENLKGRGSRATSRVNSDGVGTAGGVNISANNLTLTNGGRVDSSTKGEGDAGSVNIQAKGDITFDGENLKGDRSGATSRVDSGGVGNAGEVKISANNLTLTNGGRVDSSTSGTGDAGSVNIQAKGDITFDGENLQGDRSGATSRVNSNGVGSAGEVNISANNLTLTNGGRVDSSTSGTANAEDVTQSETEESGIINLQIAEDITLQDDSSISAQASGNANGGNLNINARFIIAEPNSNSDITASAEQGQGGKIDINASPFGIEERPQNNLTNDIDASSESNVDGNITINTIGFETFQTTAEPPANIVESDGVVARVCDQAKTAQSTLTIKDRGAVPPQPIETLASNNILLDTQPLLGNGETGERRQAEKKEKASLEPLSPIMTAQGAIYPARGVVQQADGTIILTANNINHNQRTPNYSPNCG